MAKRINLNTGAAAQGGVGIGLMTSAGNPWTLPDTLADELVNRNVATYVDAQVKGLQPMQYDPLTGQQYAGGAPVSVAGNTAIPPAAPYRLAVLGDSRTGYLSSGTQIGGAGSGAGTAGSRITQWAAGYLTDAEVVGWFGISGDTLISGSSTTGWDGVSRSNSKTFANLIATAPDIVYIQYGINDLPAATSAALISAAKALVSKLLAAGIRACLSNIMTFDPTAATPNISPANAAATLVKINEFRDAMSAYVVGLSGRAVFVDPNPLISLASGYADQQYMTTADTQGVHPSRRGSQIIGYQAAQAIRTLLPLRTARTYTLGPLSQPNLVDPAASSNLYAQNSVQGTTSATTPAWAVDASTGVPYAEVTFTVSALNGSNIAQAFFKVEATDVAGGSPKWPIAIGDVIQGSARVTVDDGSGAVAAGLQVVQARVRMFSSGAASQFFNDWDGVAGATATSLSLPFDCRCTPPVSASPIASANIDTPQGTNSRGFFYSVTIEVNATGTYRVRLYSPSLRVVSRAQPAAVTPGASPYVWQNNPQPFVLNDFVNSTGRDAQVTVSGGTVSQIAIGRGPTVAGSFLNAVNTGLTSGVFILKPGDGLVVTYTVAPTMTATYL